MFMNVIGGAAAYPPSRADSCGGLFRSGYGNPPFTGVLGGTGGGDDIGTGGCEDGRETSPLCRGDGS